MPLLLKEMIIGYSENYEIFKVLDVDPKLKESWLRDQIKTLKKQCKEMCESTMFYSQFKQTLVWDLKKDFEIEKCCYKFLKLQSIMLNSPLLEIMENYYDIVKHFHSQFTYYKECSNLL